MSDLGIALRAEIDMFIRRVKQITEDEFQPTPRPLSKGDWVEYDGLLVYVTNPVGNRSIASDKSFCGITLNGNYDDKFGSEFFTRIDLTEEYLKMLDDDKRFYLVSRMNNGIHWEVTENCRIPSSDGGFRIFKQWCWHETKDGAIREAVSDVVARRHFDKMGV